VVERILDPRSKSFPLEGESNPFLRYRTLTYAHDLALDNGMTDAAFVELVSGLDGAVRRVCGRGFEITPGGANGQLSRALGLRPPGGVFVKDETGNVAGSHKGRHLMGLAILGEVRLRSGLAPRDSLRLAIASCGNAALAAAVVARAWEKPLDVYIPEDADPKVVAEIRRHGAAVHVCVREAGQAGDPCYRAFRAAVDAGAMPFCCQGPDNGLTIEGGETLGWEMVGQLAQDTRKLDRLFVQVGGGALASACVQAFREAQQLGVELSFPRVHAVQTRGAFPLRRAWERLTARIVERLGLGRIEGDRAIAEALQAHARSREVHLELDDYAAKHRSELMWPWETPPHSIAHGILDDETYDWHAIVSAMIHTGGYPVVVSEERLVEAAALGHAKTGVNVDETGAAGLAGLIELLGMGEVGDHETVGVVFSGVRR
jgi:threonine synthase